MARHYEWILRDYQDNIMISVKLGALYLKMKAYDQAIVVYQRALQYDPNNLYLLEALASSYLMIKDYPSALKTFETIIRLKPDDRIVHHRIASLALQLSDYEKALYHYHFIESSSENQSDVQRGIGFSLYQLKRPQEAVSYLEKAARLNDKDVLSMTLLAGIFQDQKDFERSDEYFEKVLRADPENDLILNNYSYSLADRGVHLDKALKMIRRVMEKSPDNSHYLDTYGWVLFRLGRYDQALRYIQKSYDLDSSSWEVAMHLGDIYEQLNQTVKALHYFERALHSGGNQEILKPKIEKLMKERQNEK
jgi:tetratricopeptide (TPR) repeat protein